MQLRTPFITLLFLSACGAPEPTPSVLDLTQAQRAGGVDVHDRAALVGGAVASVDARGRARLILGATAAAAPRAAAAEDAARAHLERNAASLGLDGTALAALELVAAQDLGDGGRLVRLRQRVQGLEVFRSEARVLLRTDGSLVGLSSSLQPAPSWKRARRPFRLAAPAALTAALNERLAQTRPGELVVPDDVIDVGARDDEVRRFALAPGAALVLPHPASVKPVLYPRGAELIPAWRVELYAGAPGSTRSDAFRYVLAAEDGSVLVEENLTSSDSFTYRVWAGTTGDKRPLDGPTSDFSPKPSGSPDGVNPTIIASSLVSVEGLNHNPAGRADPWLPAGAQESRGNNVDAYVDRAAPDGLTTGEGDFRAPRSSAGSFAYDYDFAMEPTDADSQASAGLMQAFYVVNWLHDYWYDSKFDEVAGNAQADNFGRGGKDDDAMLLEGQDDVFDGASDNANMSVPSDGTPPRMQIYVWSGRVDLTLTLTPGGSVTASGAAFGPTEYRLTGAVVAATDTGGISTTDGCETIGAAVRGKIALVDRGNCMFKLKAVNAETAGAVGILIADNTSDTTPPRPADGEPATDVKIPVLTMTKEDGADLRAAANGGGATATLVRDSDPARDGGLDSTLVAHEWGHYLHHRLADCSAKQCAAMSEGWGDFLALHLMLRDGDNLDATYASAVYAGGADVDAGYYGIRRMPYSVNKSKNGYSFRHISNGVALPGDVPHQTFGPNSEVHNAGEVWATMLFEAYVGLIKDGKQRDPALSFDDARRRMADYIVTGLQLTPVDATFTEQRDTLLAAAFARDPRDLAALAAGFARRGAGSCAVSPPRDSDTFVGVVESADVTARVDLGEVTLTDGDDTCDHDGVLDAGEHGTLKITVQNGGPQALKGARLKITPGTSGLTLVDKTSFDLPDLAPFSSTQLTAQVLLAAGNSKMTTLKLTLESENAGSCTAGKTRELVWRGNYDEEKASSATDDVEGAQTVWTLAGDPAQDIWTRAVTVAPNHAWRGVDYGAPSDTQLVSPPLQVPSGKSFVIKFDHRFKFEAADEEEGRVYYDGAVIEISEDNGATWKDVATYKDPGYGGKITDVSGNPLANKMALVDDNKSWPKTDAVRLDLGTKLGGKTVKVRFRIGTDQAAGDFGWEIDNLAFEGISNTPFGLLADNTCGMGGGAKSGGGCAVGTRGGSGAAALTLAGLLLLCVRRRRRR